jgi:hypothetical protein
MVDNGSSSSPEYFDVARVERGRKTVVSVLIISVALAVLTEAEYLIRVGTNKFPQQIVRSIILALLLLMLYRGHRWARYISALCLGIGGLLGVVLFAKVLFAGIPSVDLLAMAAGYTWSAVALFSFSSVGEFQRYQRARRTRGASHES